MKFVNDSDYIIYYSEKLKLDSSLFEQQRKFLNSQLKSSIAVFANWKGNDFKKRAREYLNARGLI